MTCSTCLTSPSLSFLICEWVGEMLPWGMTVMKVQGHSDRPSACLAQERQSIKWRHWLIHNITRAQGLKRYLNILIGVLVALVLLFSLLLFLLLRHWRQRKCRMSGE